LIPPVLAAEGIPEGYKEVYQQDFERPRALNDFRYTDPRAWRIGEVKGNHALELHAASAYEPAHRSPGNIAVMFTMQLESFVLEADLLQTGREYGHRDMCVLFGFVDPSKYYYAHIATKTDDHAHNVMIVNDAPRTKISTMTTEGVDWGQEKWHKVRLVRDGANGTIEVYFDDMRKPIMTAEDKTFPKGYVGFGSFDDTGMIDNVKVWAPKAEAKAAAALFAAKPLKPIEEEPDLKADGFQSIFDGRTLDGWRRADGKASGRMEYKVEDDAIVGTCVPKEPNGFLCSEKKYRDFIFTCEVKFDVPGNSGIQFRSNQRADDGRVYGYQCEIDHSGRRYSGGLYDEARRAWLFPLWGEAYAKAREAFKEGEWNRFTIKARGRRLQTWVNGVPCTDYTDTDAKDFTPEGFIALQVHGGPQGQIRWRHLRIRELEPMAMKSRSK
jgi:hypothetical protein